MAQTCDWLNQGPLWSQVEQNLDATVTIYAEKPRYKTPLVLYQMAVVNQIKMILLVNVTLQTRKKHSRADLLLELWHTGGHLSLNRSHASEIKAVRNTAVLSHFCRGGQPDTAW